MEAQHDERHGPRPGSEPPAALAEQLWAEHGWALRGRHIALLLAVVAMASVAAELIAAHPAPPPTIHATGPSAP